MVMYQDFVKCEVRAKGDIAEETKSRPLGDSFVLFDNGFDLWVVRRDAATYEAVRRWQTIKEINLY